MSFSTPDQLRQQRSWYCYDWGNSAFTTTVVTLFLGPYLTSIAKAAAGDDGRIHPFGLSIDPRSLWSYLVSLSVLTQVICLPLVGAIADYGKKKREFLGALALIGVASTVGMFFIEGTKYLLGAILFLISNLAFGASIVIYNSFLPEIAPPEERDAVSSKGWGLGYLGGGLLLCLNLYMYSNAKNLGLSDGMAVRISLLSAGLWWGLFTVPAYMGLRNSAAAHPLPKGQNYLSIGVRQLIQLFKDIRLYPQALLFLIAFLLYNDGIQTVISLSSQFGSDSLHMSMASLTQAILMVQFVAFFGAIAFNFIAKYIGAKKSVILSLFIWTGALVYIWLAVSTERDFFIMAFVVAIVLGGSQALSRSLFSQLIPKGREAEFFSIYEISDKGTSWISPLLFGLVMDMTHDYHLAIFSLVVFFIAGLLVLLPVNVAKGMQDAVKKPMPADPKIFLDGTPLSGPPGGIRRFTEELYKALPAEWPVAHFGLLSDQQDPKPQGWRKRWWSLGLPAALRENKAKLFHGVDFAVPYIPVCPTVMTVHDLSPWTLPDPNNQRVRERAGWLLRLRVPTLIHTPSAQVRQELIEHFDWPEDRVYAIPLAAAAHLHPSNTNPHPRPYVLSVATLEPRKNLQVVLEACQSLWNEGHDFDLLLAGQTREGFTLPQNQRTNFLGYVEESTLASYFSNALCTVYPSTYEGFGLPILEAMQSGSPVVVSDIPVLHETAGRAALYAPPQDPSAWAAALRSLLENKAERESRSQLGLARASEFSWAKTARAMKELYERCIG